MENTSFYFFSTVPQVLAAVIGIIGAFHIFRNQETLKSLYGYAESVIEKGTLINHGDINPLLKRLSEALVANKLEQVEGCLESISQINLVEQEPSQSYPGQSKFTYW